MIIERIFKSIYAIVKLGWSPNYAGFEANFKSAGDIFGDLQGLKEGKKDKFVAYESFIN